MDCSPWDSVRGLSQARILECVAISSSGGSSQPREQTQVSCISCIGRQILYYCATWEAQLGTGAFSKYKSFNNIQTVECKYSGKKLSVIICIPIIATANIGKVHNLSSQALGTGSPALAQDSGRYHKNNSRSKSGVMHWFQWRRLWGWPAVMILAYDCVMLTWSPTSLSLETTMLALGNHCQLFVPHGGSWLDLPWACNIAGLKTQENQMSLRFELEKLKQRRQVESSWVHQRERGKILKLRIPWLYVKHSLGTPE